MMKTFKFTSETIIEAESEDEAKSIFANTSEHFAYKADCEEVIDNSKRLNVYATINICIETPFTTPHEAYEFAQNYELPHEYIEDSFDTLKIVVAETKEEIKHNEF